MKKLVLSAIITCVCSFAFSQQIPQTINGKYHVLSVEELGKGQLRSREFIATDPPANPRSIAEFEPNQGVIVAAPSGWNGVNFGIPYSLIAELSENEIVYVIGDASLQSSITSVFQSNDVNLSNVRFVGTPIDSYWTRDYSPWFIEYGNKQIGMIDYVYNRPRPNDDDATNFFGEYFDIPVFGMEVVHTGGNYMTDGLGTATSCAASLITENEEEYNYTESELDLIFENYLGITNYMYVEDPLNDYIAHIDCWGKFLDVDKILITQVPASNSQYAEYEAMADFWANQTSSYGNKYQVFRTYSPNGEPYSNSLILNNKVYLAFPIGQNANNAAAADVYEAAMPGYEVIGFTPNSNSWESTDALHCRTHEVPKFDMLRIAHYPILDSVDFQDEYTFNATVYSFNNSGNITSVKLFYKVNDGEYNSVDMNNIGGDEYSISLNDLQRDQKISYYLKAENDNNQIETHPFIGESDPHVFYIRNSEMVSIGNQESEAYIKCYPNPASETLYLISNRLPSGSYTIDFFNNQGVIVKSLNENISSQWENRTININDLSNGIYFVRIYDGDKTFTCKFSKI